MVRQSTKPTLEALQLELADADYKVRKEAIRKLMRYQRTLAVEPLLGVLEDGRGDVRVKAVQALGRLKDTRALLPLLGLLKDKSASVRAQVARVLGNFGDRSVVRPLHALLNDPKPTIRQAAARSLGQLRDPSSLPLLLAYLKRAENAEVYHLAYALGDFDMPAVIEPLLAFAENDESLQGVVAEGLSRLGASKTPALIQILSDQQRPSINRRCVALAFFRKPRPGTLQPLLQALGEHDAQLSQQAVQALGSLKDPAALGPILQTLTSPDERVCISAIYALSLLDRTTAAIDPLIACLSSKHENVVYAAAQALRGLNATSAVPALVKALCRMKQWHNWPVVMALYDLGSPAIVDELLQILPTLAREQCSSVVYILERFPDPRSVEPLLALLDPSASNGLDSNLQVQIVRLLNKLGDARALEPLREMRAQTSGMLQSAIIHTLNSLEAVRQQSA